MKDQFMTLRFGVEIGLAALLCLIIYVAARVYNKSGEREVKVDYSRTPTSNALVVIGLLVPLMVGVASYLYVSNPERKYSSLLATIVVMFVVLVVAIWETFALLQKGGNSDSIKIKLPQDRRYIIGLGWMYALLLLSLVYFGMFFLFELPATGAAGKPEPAGPAVYVLLKPQLKIDQTKDETLRAWGYRAAKTRLIGFCRMSRTFQ